MIKDYDEVKKIWQEREITILILKEKLKKEGLILTLDKLKNKKRKLKKLTQ